MFGRLLILELVLEHRRDRLFVTDPSYRFSQHFGQGKLFYFVYGDNRIAKGNAVSNDDFINYRFFQILCGIA